MTLPELPDDLPDDLPPAFPIFDTTPLGFALKAWIEGTNPKIENPDETMVQRYEDLKGNDEKYYGSSFTATIDRVVFQRLSDRRQMVLSVFAKIRPGYSEIFEVSVRVREGSLDGQHMINAFSSGKIKWGQYSSGMGLTEKNSFDRTALIKAGINPQKLENWIAMNPPAPI
jgi:hypothetical protein